VLGRIDVAALPEVPVEQNGVTPQGPSGPPTQWIVIGPRTRQQMATVLEPQLAAVWVALLETSGVAPEQEFKLVIGEAHLEPVPKAPANGQAP
jgi:hypothetical protein